MIMSSLKEFIRSVSHLELMFTILTFYLSFTYMFHFHDLISQSCERSSKRCRKEEKMPNMTEN